MTDEVLKLALDALEGFIPYLPLKDEAQCNRYDQAIRAIKEALETKDDPVAWGMEKDKVILDVICPDEHDREEGSYTVPLYTTPQRTWVGLTKMELIKCGVFPWGNSYQLYEAIEAKLKDKNDIKMSLINEKGT